VFFLAGSAVFLVCAMQIYLGKLLKWRVATRGLYRCIRHPQYLALAVAGLGLAILWPRFLTLILWSIMLFLYFLLAKDEERRMINLYGDEYAQYLARTGMFLPRFYKKPLTVKPLRIGAALLLLIALIGGTALIGFGLRSYTIAHLPITQIDGIDVITIMQDDIASAKAIMPMIQNDPGVAERLRSMRQEKGTRILAYFIPTEYVMQGMIADTGPEWKLFHRHQTLAMIVDYILHPKAHLQGGHMQHMAMMHGQTMNGQVMNNCPLLSRRIIFLEIHTGHPTTVLVDDFAINSSRTPWFFIDANIHTGTVLQIKDTPHGTGWGNVPTPMF